MNLVSTITGLPYVGKTTLFNLLTGGHASTGAFAGAEAETNVGVAKVPDERVDKLSALFKPKKTTYAEVMYRDLGLAHSAFARQQWKEAESRYDDIVKTLPDSDAAPEALYWAGVSRYKSSGDPTALQQTTEAFKIHYQGSTWAKKASVWAK